MTCRQVKRENIVEHYLAGTLGPARMREFEEHYFECDVCTKRLDDWFLIEPVLRQSRHLLTAPPPVRGWLWTAAAIAAMTLIGLSAPRVPPTLLAPPPVQLEQLDPPGFLFPVRRGSPTQWEFQFQEAMRSYPIHDYRSTIDGLKSVVETWPAADAPRFFLGACHLLAGRAKDAIRELRQVASGDSPFAEEARFYLAHAYLREGRRPEALETLRTLASTEGEFTQKARSLLSHLN
jgi:tetratricopeptide (TPR) repeat protein